MTEALGSSQLRWAMFLLALILISVQKMPGALEVWLVVSSVGTTTPPVLKGGSFQAQHLGHSCSKKESVIVIRGQHTGFPRLRASWGLGFIPPSGLETPKTQKSNSSKLSWHLARCGQRSVPSFHLAHTVNLVCSFTPQRSRLPQSLSSSSYKCQHVCAEQSRVRDHNKQLCGPRCPGQGSPALCKWVVRGKTTMGRSMTGIVPLPSTSNFCARLKGTFCFCPFGEVAFSWYLGSQEKKSHWVFTLAFR